MNTRVSRTVGDCLREIEQRDRELRRQLEEAREDRDKARNDAEALKLTGIGELHEDYNRAMEELCAHDFRIGTLHE